MSPQTTPASPTGRSDDDSAQSDFDRLWNEALKCYEEETGKDLLKLPFAKQLLSRSGTTDEVIQYIKEQNDSFEAFRTSGRKVLNVAKPIVHFVHLFIDAGAEGASNVTPGGKAIFVAISALLQAAKGVSALYDAIELLLQKIGACLARIQIYLEPSSPPNPALMDILRMTLVQVFIVLGIVTKYCDKAGDEDPKSKGKKGVKAMMQRMKDYSRVFLGETDVEEALKELEELTEEEQLAAAADTNAVVRHVRTKVDYIYNEAVIEALRTWLDAPNPTPINYDAKRRAGSCEWFVNDRFEDWKATKGGMYWVLGHAGAGKSIICSSVVDLLQEDPELLLAYFYFDEADPKKQDHRGLVSSLVFQLGTGSEKGLDHLKGQRSLHPPTHEKLLSLLSQLLGLSGPTVIVIDALDECPERAREGLLQLLDHLRSLRSHDDIDLHVLVTSRPEIDIQNCLSFLATHTLDVNASRDHREDIRSYISTQLFDPESRSFPRWDSDVKWKVYHVLIERANGMFLWVVFQLQDLKHCAAEDVERALDELPSDLDRTYERILRRFPSKPAMVARALRVFECVGFAARPLSTAAVAAIISMDFDSLPLRVPLTPDVQTEDPEPIIHRTCPRLLEIILDDKGGKFVQFIHRSVKEYLISTTLRRATSSPAYPYSFDESSAHLTLAKICLWVLVVNDTLSGLREYADRNWDIHVSPHNEDALSELLDLFLRMDSPAFVRWEEVRFQYTAQINGTAFHCAARLGLYRHVARMLERSRLDLANLTDARDWKGETALHRAANSGHVEVCRVLLEHGALVDDVDKDGNTSLHNAAHSGNLDTVHLLLQHPAADGSDAAALRCRTRNKRGQTALHRAADRAADRGNVEVCRVLLEHGALVEDVDNDGYTPLHIAAHEGHQDTVRLLLQHPAADGSNTVALRYRTRDKQGQTALHRAADRAADRGNIEVCRVLLEHGALVEDVDNDGNTSLHLAVDRRCDVDIVSLLLQHPAADGSDTAALRCRTRNKRGQTALHRAAYWGRVDVCRVLLEHGALVDDADDDGNTFLQVAKNSLFGSGVVSFLSKYGAKDVFVESLRDPYF